MSRAIMRIQKAESESLAWLATKLRDPRSLDMEEHVILSNELVKRVNAAVPVERRIKNSQHYYTAVRLEQEMDENTKNCEHPLVIRYRETAENLASTANTMFDTIKDQRIRSFRNVPQALMLEFHARHEAFKAAFEEHAALDPEMGFMQSMLKIAELKQSIETLEGQVKPAFSVSPTLARLTPHRRPSSRQRSSSSLPATRSTSR